MKELDKMDAAPRPALFARFPQLERSIAWRSFGVRCTPLERVDLELPGGGTRRILVKRDDLTARPYGGNKVRKLEFVLADAHTRGATRVITAGAAGSHHGLATTLYARELGMDATLVLFPQARTEHVRRVLLLDQALGADLRFTPRMETVPLAVARARLAHRREAPYLIAPGGSDAIGTLGYVSAGLELADQIDVPASIHMAAGTLGTVAGLALGLALAGIDVPIRATRITSRVVCNEMSLRRLIGRTAVYLRRAGVDAIPAERAVAMVKLRHDQIGPGYGRETDAARTASRIFDAAGLALDPTYTAKAAADLLATPDSSAGISLFLHTLSASEPMELARDTKPADLPRPFRTYLER